MADTWKCDLNKLLFKHNVIWERKYAVRNANYNLKGKMHASYKTNRKGEKV